MMGRTRLEGGRPISNDVTISCTASELSRGVLLDDGCVWWVQSDVKAASITEGVGVVAWVMVCEYEACVNGVR
jgi:hypothetical protein